jgi:alkylated DNA repair dioxygenase AlkB/Sec-independent protein translocase protein TatA
MSMGEIILILFVYLLLFEPRVFPPLAQTLGKAVYQFRNAARDVQNEIMQGTQEIRKSAQIRMDHIDLGGDDETNSSAQLRPGLNPLYPERPGRRRPGIRRRRMDSRNQILIHQNGAEELLLIPDFIAPDYHGIFRQGLHWQQNEIRVFGKWHPEPRLTAWYGPPYRYSSVTWPAREIPPVLEEIRIRLNETMSFPFNAVLANYYRTGKDSMGWHRDNEPEIDQTLIASVSVGTTRRFRIRHRAERIGYDVDLEPGSLLCMRNMQTDWEHCVPKASGETGERINLTFRRITVPR